MKTKAIEIVEINIMLISLFSSFLANLLTNAYEISGNNNGKANISPNIYLVTPYERTLSDRIAGPNVSKLITHVVVSIPMNIL